jgi:hypothetical protein
MPSKKAVGKFNDSKVQILLGLGIIAGILAYKNRHRITDALQDQHEKDPIMVPASKRDPPRSPLYTSPDNSGEYDSEDWQSSTLTGQSTPTRNPSFPGGPAGRRATGELENQCDPASSSNSASRESLNLLSFGKLAGSNFSLDDC